MEHLIPISTQPRSETFWVTLYCGRNKEHVWYKDIPDNITLPAAAAVSADVLLVRHALVEDAGEADGEADRGAEEGDGHHEEAPLQPRPPVPPRHLLDLHVHLGGGV